MLITLYILEKEMVHITDSTLMPLGIRPVALRVQRVGTDQALYGLLFIKTQI